MAAIVNITYQLGPAVSGWLLVKCLFLGAPAEGVLRQRAETGG